MEGGEEGEETYEAEGQHVTDDALDFEKSLAQLQEVCVQLGMPDTNKLDLAKFGSVCAYIGMGDFKNQEMSELFTKIDTDNDGFISLPELIGGLPSASTISASAQRPLRSSSRSHGSTKPRSRSHSRSRSRAEDRASRNSSRTGTPAMFVGGYMMGLFTAMEATFEGFANAEDILDYMEGLGISTGADILSSLGFNPHGKVKLTELTSALDLELTNPDTSEATQGAALMCYQEEVRHLKSVVDQRREESKKLKVDLSESNARNNLLAKEVDERHAHLEISMEAKMTEVDLRYQEQVKALQTELDREREAGAAQSARLRGQLEEMQGQAQQEEQRLVDRLARAQKDITRMEKDLQDSAEQEKSLTKINDQLRIDLHHKVERVDDMSPLIEDPREELMEVQGRLERKMEEVKHLKDDNDELLTQLDDLRHSKATKRPNSARVSPSPSLIPVMRGSDMFLRSRLSISSMEGDTEGDDSGASTRGMKAYGMRGKRPKLGGSSQSLDLDYLDAPSLSKELSQLQTQEMERERRNMQDMLEREKSSLQERFHTEMLAIQERHERERERIVGEKEWIIEEQKVKEESALASLQEELEDRFAREREDIMDRHATEIQRLQDRVSADQSTTSMDALVHSLEAQVAQCQEEVRGLEREREECRVDMKQQEVTLRQAFEDERQNLAERFSRELEQRQQNHRQTLDTLFARGVDSLSGKLRDDFLSLVRKHTEEEVGRSQASILTQLQQDRSGIAAALEIEKAQIYEAADKQKQEMAEKCEAEMVGLRHEIKDVRAQLEAEKAAFTEAAQRTARDTDRHTQDVVHTLRQEMEAELLTELQKMKETMDGEKRELETQKTLLEEELTELQGLLEAEQGKTREMTSVKETMKVLKSEKREVEGMVEGMKAKLFEAYRQKGMETADSQGKLNDAKEEGRKIGVEEGVTKGKEEGKNMGHKAGYSEGYSTGRREGVDDGRREGVEVGRKEKETALAKMEGELQNRLESSQREASTLKTQLAQEKDKGHKMTQAAQDRERLKSKFNDLLSEKQALETRYQGECSQMQDEFAQEKNHLMEEIRRLETQRLQLQANAHAVEAHMGAVHQELAMAQQDVETLDSPSSKDACTEVGGESELQEQMTLLSYQLTEAQAAQHELGQLKAEYEALLHEKNDLEDNIYKLKSRSAEEENMKIKAQTAEIELLKEEKFEIQALLDQSSNQLDKSSTSMALAQSQFVRDLEGMKHKAKSAKEVENYTALQMSLVEHQRLVMTLQDTLREREALVEKVLQDGEEEVCRVTHVMEAKLREARGCQEGSQEKLMKQGERNKQLTLKLNKRNQILKDLYLKNAELLKGLADVDEKHRRSERERRTAQEKYQTYKRTIDRLSHTLAR